MDGVEERERWLVGDYYKASSIIPTPPKRKSDMEALLERVSLLGNLMNAFFVLYYGFLIVRFSGIDIGLLTKYVQRLWFLSPEEIMARYPLLYDVAWYGYLGITLAYMVYHQALKVKTKKEYVEIIPSVEVVFYTLFMLFSSLLILVTKDPAIITFTVLMMVSGTFAFRRDVDNIIKRLNKGGRQ